MKKIKIKFVDYWEDFDRETDIVTIILKKKYDVEFSEKPDYIFYGPFSDEHLEYNDVIKICWYGEDIVPDFNLCDYAIGYDYISFGDRYLRFPGVYKKDFDKMLSPDNLFNKIATKHNIVNENMLNREFCSFVYSNGNADPFRTKLFEAINQYKKVASGGRYKNNIEEFPNGVPDKIEFESKYKFSIACENSSHSGYLSEKLLDAFAAGTVPIYWGDPDVDKIFNKKSFIDCQKFSNIDEIVAKVKELDENNELYLEMLREPAFVTELAMQSKMIERLENFLYNIFDQDISKAYRRNFEYWGKNYYEQIYKKKKLYNWSSKINNTCYKILKKMKINKLFIKE